jgi:hypothetical protein
MLGWAEVEMNVVRVAEVASFVLDAECVATAASEELVNMYGCNCSFCAFAFARSIWDWGG